MNESHITTKAPWYVTDEGSQIVIQTHSAHPTGTIARIYRTDELAHADAQLIAAAPELLAALQIAEATLERLAPNGSRATQGTRDVIAAAIAKATR